MTPRDIWYRSIYAVLILGLVYLLLFAVVGPAWGAAIIRWLTPALGPQGAVYGVIGLFGMIPAVIAVGILTAADRYSRAKRDGEMETRCRKCQHILRGITEPRCPECGERI